VRFIRSITEKLTKGRWKTIKMSKETRGIFEILIAEVQGCNDMQEVRTLLDSWIKVNDFHPEKVERLSNEEFRVKFKL